MSQLIEVYGSIGSRMNFMKGCIRLAKADGQISENEKQFFINAANSLNLHGSNLEELTSLMADNNASIDICFETKKQSLFFINQAIQLCYVDGKYSESERKEITSLASQLGVATEAIDKIEEWVLQGMTWVKAGEELLTKLEEN